MPETTPQPTSEVFAPCPRPGGEELEPQTLVPGTEHGDALTELSSHVQMLRARNKLRELAPVIDLYAHMVQIMDSQAEEIARLKAKVHELEFPTG
jgi:hypothetical protein